MPIPQRYSAADAIELVERIATQTMGRRIRQNGDYHLQRNDPYNTNTNVDGEIVGTDFKSVTSTVAGAFVHKVVSILSAAKVLIQMPYGHAQQEQRQLFDIKEQFAYGLLDQANEELVRRVELEIHEQVTWYAPVRGWLVGVWLLRNTDDGQSRALIRPWDPLNSYWQVGKDGLNWACEKVRRKLVDIRADWPDANLDGDDEEERDEYNFYTPTMNAVFTDDEEMLKEWTPHGSPSHPVVIVPVATQPRVWSDSIPDTEDDYGESVLATNRGLYEQISEIMSITLDLLQYAREPSAIAFSNEEDTEFEDNPQTGKKVSYMAGEDRFQSIPSPETTKDAVQLAQMVMGMIQRGDLPFTSYGDIQFALSGFAITQLNQQMLTVIGPQTRALARWYNTGLNLLVDQFVTGGFNPLTIRGAGQNRDYTTVTVQPEWLKNLPPFKVQVVAELPEDDVAKLNVAQLVATGPDPLMPRRWVYDEFLAIPDSRLIDTQLKEQAAERGDELAVAITLGKAAQEAGRPELVQVYQMKVQMLIQLQQLQQLQLQLQAGVPPGASPPGLPGGAQNRAPTGSPNPPTGQEGQPGLPRRS